MTQQRNAETMDHLQTRNVGSGTRSLVALFGLLIIALMSSCSDTADANDDVSADTAVVFQYAEQARNAGYTDQYELLSDGDATQADYELALDRNFACIRDSGMEVTNTYVNSIDSLQIFYDVDPLGKPPREVTEVTTRCPEQFLLYVQDAFGATNPSLIDPAVLLVMEECWIVQA